MHFAPAIRRHFYQLDAALHEQRQTALVEQAAKDESPVPETRVVSRQSLRADPKVLGRMEIPRLGVSGVIREGADAKTLRRAVAHAANESGFGLHSSRALGVV